MLVIGFGIGTWMGAGGDNFRLPFMADERAQPAAGEARLRMESFEEFGRRIGAPDRAQVPSRDEPARPAGSEPRRRADQSDNEGAT